MRDFAPVRAGIFGWQAKAAVEALGPREIESIDLASIEALVLGVDPSMGGSVSLVAHPVHKGPDPYERVLGIWRWHTTQVGGQKGTFVDGGMYSSILARKEVYAYLAKLLLAIARRDIDAGAKGGKRLPYVPLLIRIEGQHINPKALNSIIPTASSSGLWISMVGASPTAAYAIEQPSAWRSYYGIKGLRERVKAEALARVRMLYRIPGNIGLTDDDAEAVLLAGIPQGTVLVNPNVKKRKRKK